MRSIHASTFGGICSCDRGICRRLGHHYGEPFSGHGSGTPPPTPFSPATQGVRLFASKGCIGCHRHIEVNPEATTEARLDLTGKRFPTDYLKTFLRDPSIKPAEMPNLNLTADEVEALAAFINKSAVKSIPAEWLCKKID